MSKASKIMSQLRGFLDERGFGYMLEGDDALRGLVSGESVQWQWVIRLCGNDQGIVSFHAYCPLKVNVEHRASAAEYLMRANWGLNFGNFEIDWSDGQVCFRTSISAARSGVSVKAMSDLVYAPCAMMDRYVPGLLTVALGNTNPLTAISDAERDRTSVLDDNSLIDASPATLDAKLQERSSRIDRLFGSEN